MTEQIRQIAERIKDLREISGISTEKLATELGVTTDLYEKYESGGTDIPVGFLFKIAQRFDVELLPLLNGDNPKLHIFSVVRKGKGLDVHRRKKYKYESLAYNFVHKKAEPFLVTVDPENSPVEFNAHPGQEYNYVIEGSMKLFIDSYEIDLEEGDSIYFDSGHQHAMKALNNKRVRFLAIIL